MKQKYLIVSDSHGSNFTIRKALMAHPDADYLVHLGDSEDMYEEIRELAKIPCYMVKGNSDSFRCTEPLSEIIPAGKHRLLAVHGHLQNVRYNYNELIKMAKDNGCDIVLFGHIHVPVYENMEGITIINPGSITLPRQKGYARTYGILTFNEDDSFRFDFFSVDLSPLS